MSHYTFWLRSCFFNYISRVCVFFRAHFSPLKWQSLSITKKKIHFVRYKIMLSLWTSQVFSSCLFCCCARPYSCFFIKWHAAWMRLQLIWANISSGCEYVCGDLCFYQLNHNNKRHFMHGAANSSQHIIISFIFCAQTRRFNAAEKFCLSAN